MWPFNKRISLVGSGLFRGFTDWHSHILPGVDDGVETMAEALDILHRYEVLGVKAVWLTPHIMEDCPNTTAALRARFAELQATYKGSVRLNLAAENMLDNLFEERLEQGDLLPLGESGDRLLVETSYFTPPMGLSDILQRIKSRGYYPVLAHPERYVYMDTPYYQRLKSLGVLFQLNLPSLLGLYGKVARLKAHQLLEKGCYDLTGTDLHALDVLETAARQKLNHATLAQVRQIP